MPLRALSLPIVEAKLCRLPLRSRPRSLGERPPLPLPLLPPPPLPLPPDVRRSRLSSIRMLLGREVLRRLLLPPPKAESPPPVTVEALLLSL
jgi:hypothetical protein